MPQLSATGILSRPLASLAALVASSDTFQALVDADDADAALASVYYPFADDGVTDDGAPLCPHPRAIIGVGGDWRSEEVGVGDWRGTGSLILNFEFLIPLESATEQVRGNDINEMLWFLNTVGAILAEMQANKYDDPSAYPNILAIDLLEGPAKVGGEFKGQYGDYTGEDVYGVMYQVKWQG